MPPSLEHAALALTWVNASMKGSRAMKRVLTVSLSVLTAFVLATVLLLPRIPVRAGAPPTTDSQNGDVNGDGMIDVSDAGAS